MGVGTVEFRERLDAAGDAGWKQLEATNALNAAMTSLREVCPHLLIAACNAARFRDLRVCQHCGIQEIDWHSNFKTLTAPGDSRYETENDKSKSRRNGARPVLTPRSEVEVFSYRRGTHVDVTEK